METQIQSFYRTSKGINFISCFGYATKGVPSLEVHGLGRLSKNIKEKIIFLSRNRKLSIPLRRYVLCVDVNGLEEVDKESLKWLEFPLLLLYWHMAGLIPISKLEDCICSGWLNTSGEITQMKLSSRFVQVMTKELCHGELANLKLIHSSKGNDYTFWSIEPSLLLEHIRGLSFKTEEIFYPRLQALGA